MASHELLQGLIEATLAGSAAILLVLALRWPLRRAFGARAAYALWLLVPLAIVATLLPAATADAVRAPAVRMLVLPADFAVTAAPAQAGIDWRGLLPGLWLCGALACGLLLWRAQTAFRHGLGRLLPHGEALRAQTVSAGLPATLGLWHPQVVLPADFDTRFEPEQRALVLAHERRHIARRDPWANAVAALLRCLFWFNPLLHFAAARMRHDQELACDADVLAAHPQQRRSYGDALLNAQLALQVAPLGCHFGFGHPLKERIAMLAHPVSTNRRWLGSAALACLLLGGGYAAWAAQPATPVVVPANGIAADIVLRVDEDAPRTLRIVSEADKPFSLESDANGRRFTIAGTVSRVEHPDKPAMMLQLRIDEDGKRIAEPKLVVANGKPAAVHLGTETQAQDGGKAFKGLRLDITLTDSTKVPVVTMSRSQANMREMISGLARDHGMTVTGLELIPEEQQVSMGLKGIPLETVLALVGESMDLDVRQVGKRIEISPKKGGAAASALTLQPGQVMDASRALHPPRYPADALKEGKTGVTVLVVDIDARGGVIATKVERSSGDARLDTAAQEAAAKWLFKPAMKKGQPVASKVRVPVEFAMDEVSAAARETVPRSASLGKVSLANTDWGSYDAMMSSLRNNWASGSQQQEGC